MKQTIDNVIGKTFGLLEVERFSHRDFNQNAYMLCRCLCGKETKVRLALLPHTNSCGCTRAEKGKKRKVHGDAGTAFYKKWCSMRERCKPGFSGYGARYYVGKGIEVCKRWDIYQNFKEDMYMAYLEHCREYGATNTTLDRINSDENYLLDNCQWATWMVQAKERRMSGVQILNMPLGEQ